MIPAPKYAVIAVLYGAGDEGIWEYEIYRRLRPRYEVLAVESIREDLISLSTLGWVEITEERELSGRIIRHYALGHHMRPFVEYQLDLKSLLAFVSGRADGDDQEALRTGGREALYG